MLDSLPRRSRVRRLRRALDALRGGPGNADPPRREAHDLRHRELPIQSLDGSGPISRALLARLDDDDLADLERRLVDQDPDLWAAHDPVSRQWRTIPLALAFVPGAAGKLGLIADMPPEDVHSMARGPLATGGGFAYADLVSASFEQVGAPLRDGAAILDFGCSSGRVVRVLAGVLPQVRWLGCDPNDPAIAWASEHLPGIEFHVSPLDPPLPFVSDGELDACFAISIWSHFDAGPALRWLAEMHRIIRPGGHLLLTAAGLQSLSYYARLDSSDELQRPIADDLYTRGFALFEAFPGHDWGVPADGWGLAWFTPEWLLTHVSPAWSLALYRPGWIEGNQDVYVLRREDAA